jgi:hypothetical protein
MARLLSGRGRVPIWRFATGETSSIVGFDSGTVLISAGWHLREDDATSQCRQEMNRNPPRAYHLITPSTLAYRRDPSRVGGFGFIALGDPGGRDYVGEKSKCIFGMVLRRDVRNLVPVRRRRRSLPVAVK